MLNIAPSDSLADKLTSISDLNDLLVLDNKVCEPSASSYLSIYQLVKTITFVLYLFDMVEMNKIENSHCVYLTSCNGCMLFILCI